MSLLRHCSAYFFPFCELFIQKIEVNNVKSLWTCLITTYILPTIINKKFSYSLYVLNIKILINSDVELKNNEKKKHFSSVAKRMVFNKTFSIIQWFYLVIFFCLCDILTTDGLL